MEPVPCIYSYIVQFIHGCPVLKGCYQLLQNHSIKTIVYSEGKCENELGLSPTEPEEIIANFVTCTHQEFQDSYI